VGLANPAAVACVQAGGRTQIERSPAGERGICLLPGGLRCDEWAWFRKEAGACCTTGTPPAGSDIQACR
jgi:putative hemolysin